MSDQTDFSETLRVLMARKGLSQMDLAIKLGIHAAGVSARLSGRTRWTLDEVHLVAELFDLHPSHLLFGPAHALAAYDKPVGKSSGQVPAIEDAATAHRDESA